MKILTAKQIRNLCIGYFAVAGLVFFSMIFSTQPSAIAMGSVLFGLSLLPAILPFRAFRIVYGLLAFMVSFCFFAAFLFQVWSWDASELLSAIAIGLVITGYVLASAGLTLTSAHSSDPQRFTLI